MKIIYIHQYFRTLKDWGGTRSYYLASAMAKAGHDVHLITSHNGPDIEIADIEGFKVYYLPLRYEQSFSPVKKLWAYVRFFFSSYKQAAKIGNADLVYATSTPLTVGFTALMLKKLKGKPYIFEVRDLWPEVPIALGIIKNAFIKTLLFSLTKSIYINSSAIISLSPGITQGILKYKIKQVVFELPNFADTSLFCPMEPDAGLQKKYLPDGEYGIVHFGAIGRINHLDYFLDAAAECQKAGLPLKFFIIGEGSEKQRLEKMQTDNDIHNLVFIPAVAKEQMPKWLSIMTFSYISVANIPILSSNSANKLYDSLASGKICVTNIEGWMQEMIERQECGFNTNPLDPVGFAEKIAPFLNSKSLMYRYMENARSTALKYYSSLVVSSALIDVLKGKKLD